MANSGYNLARNLLKQKDDGSLTDLDNVLKRTRHQETVWLEFKADPFIRGDHNPLETQDDYTWNIVKAIISLANSAGGCIVIGLDDNGRIVVPLKNKGSSDELSSIDQYERDLNTLLQKSEFNVSNPKFPKNKTRYIIKQPLLQQFRELTYPLEYEGAKLLAILVEESKELLFVDENNQQLTIQKCFVRARGSNGQTESLRMEDIQNYKRPSLDRLADSFSNIPAPNISFAGRENELLELDNRLQGNRGKIVVIHAPAGTGKTELVRKYADFGSDHDYDAFIYIKAEGVETLAEAFCQILREPELINKLELEIPQDLSSSDDKFKYILASLRKGNIARVFILLDNLDQSKMLAPVNILKYLKPADLQKIHIVVTTRLNLLNVTPDDPVELMELNSLPEEDAMRLLEKKRSFDNGNEANAAKDIIRFLGGNAWALDVIGEELKQTSPYTHEDYQDKLEELKKIPLKVLTPESDMVVIAHEGSIDPTLLLEPVLNRLDDVQRDMVIYAALCAPDYICADWLMWSCRQQGALPENDKQASKKFGQLIHSLEDMHILHESDDNKEKIPLLAMHRLTRIVVLEKYKELIAQLIPKLAEELHGRVKMQMNLMEVLAIANIIIYNHDFLPNDFMLFLGLDYSMGFSLLEILRYKQEFGIIDKLIAIYHGILNDVEAIEQSILSRTNESGLLHGALDYILSIIPCFHKGSKHVATETRTHNRLYLARLYMTEGWIEQYKDNFTRSRELLLKGLVFSDNVKDQINYYCRFCMLLVNYDQPDAAQECLVLVKRLIEDNALQEDIAVAHYYFNVARFFEKYNKYDKTFTYAEKSFAIKPIIGIWRLLTFLCLDKKQIDKAREYLNSIEKWSLNESQFGDGQLSIQGFNAQIAIMEQRYEDALIIQLDILKKQQKYFSPNHFRIKRTYAKLQKTYHILGDMVNEQRCRMEKIKRKDWPIERRCAMAYAECGLFDEARKMMHEILDEMPEENVIERFMANLCYAALLRMSGQVDEALVKIQTLESSTNMIAGNAEYTLEYLLEATRIFKANHNYSGANVFCDKAMKLLETDTDISRPPFCNLRCMFLDEKATLEREAGHIEEALDLHRDVIERRLALADFTVQTDTARFKSNMALTYAKAGRFRKAEKTMLEALEFFKKQPMPRKEDLLTAYSCLGEAYAHLGKNDKQVFYKSECSRIEAISEAEWPGDVVEACDIKIVMTA